VRPKIEELYSAVSGQDVFIVGGGPSLKGFDFARLKNKVTVAINDAMHVLPDATALYWADFPWVARNNDSLKSHPCKLRFMGLANAKINDTLIQGGATVLNRVGTRGLDLNPDHVCGSNSGAHALNLVANMSPKRIILLGYDMRRFNDASHWHPTDLYVPQSVYDDRFAPCVDAMAGPIQTLGIEVINCSHISALRNYKKDFVENYL